jgi:hypothetical protein
LVVYGENLRVESGAVGAGPGRDDAVLGVRLADDLDDLVRVVGYLEQVQLAIAMLPATWTVSRIQDSSPAQYEDRPARSGSA